LSDGNQTKHSLLAEFETANKHSLNLHFPVFGLSMKTGKLPLFSYQGALYWKL